MSGLLVNTNIIDGNCNVYFGQKHTANHFLVAVPPNGNYIPKEGQVAMQSIPPQINPVIPDTYLAPISLQKAPNFVQIFLSRQDVALPQHPQHCVSLAPSLITTQIFSPVTNCNTSNAVETSTSNIQQRIQATGSEDSYSDTGSQLPLETLVEQARTQAEKFVEQLNEIVCASGSPCEHGALNPQEVMEFYHTLPDDKKVRKSKRNKYRKYSLATEFEVYKKSQDTALSN